ncbi:NAD(P)-binding protein [Wolfiporia cocos MD-104 SS10]|uniref:D-xylose 1-dehydrogenase (NADP(+), D-xylono-1,5-lactone-forming) n=1 Tax=Wolfiporia cocos (strain MD-104) TaxID=742152 RepID=A0A2H3JF63_WOLCO|nr:NAD(P)-binding protein [Wolfiporia cocos MD-104 SS10]
MNLLNVINRLRKTTNPPTEAKSAGSSIVHFGILGASRIAPDAIIKPARCHEEVCIKAIAARDLGRAAKYARKWSIPKVYGGQGGYQDLVNDPEVDAVYIGLPNSLHCEWTIKALSAGKHVICDKPVANNANDTRRMFAMAAEKNLVLLEAWQPRFHPALHRMKDIVDCSELGSITSMHAHFGIWGNVMFPGDDIRYHYDLGGGAFMDLGPYPLNVMCYLTSSNPTVECARAICRPKSTQVDRRMETRLIFADTIPATIIVDHALEGWGPFRLLPRWVKITLKVECEGGTLEIWNYPLPSLWHTITVTPKRGRRRVERCYKRQGDRGEEWWSAYRYQLEAFVDKVKRRSPMAWRSAEDSINAMQVIDAVYTKVRLINDFQNATDAYRM